MHPRNCESYDGVSALAGQITPPTVDFGTSTSWHWQPFGLVTNYGAEVIAAICVDTAGTYSFSTTSDDGSMLYIDLPAGPFNVSTAVVNNGGLTGQRTRSGTAPLTAGTHQLLVHYFEANGQPAGLDVGLGCNKRAGEPVKCVQYGALCEGATPGDANCHGKCVSSLAKAFGGTDNASSSLGYSSVQDLMDGIDKACLKQS